MVLLSVHKHGEDGSVETIKRVFMLDTKALADNMGKTKFLSKLGESSLDGWTLGLQREPDGEVVALDDLSATPFSLKIKKTHILHVRAPGSPGASVATEDAPDTGVAGAVAGAGVDEVADAGVDAVADAVADAAAEAAAAEAAAAEAAAAEAAAAEAAAAEEAKKAAAAEAAAAEAAAAEEANKAAEAAAAEAAAAEAAVAKAAAAEAAAAEAAAAEEANKAAEAAAAEEAKKAADAAAAAAEEEKKAAEAAAAAAETATEEVDESVAHETLSSAGLTLSQLDVGTHINQARHVVVDEEVWSSSSSSSDSDSGEVVKLDTFRGSSGQTQTQDGQSYARPPPSPMLVTDFPELDLPPGFARMSEENQMVELLLLEAVSEVCEVESYNMMAMLMQRAAMSRVDAWKVETQRGEHELYEAGDTRFSSHIRTVIHEFDAWVSTATQLIEQVEEVRASSDENMRSRYLRKKEARARARTKSQNKVRSPKSRPSSGSGAGTGSRRRSRSKY